MDFHRTLTVVGRALDAEDCQWAVIGGVALGLFGVSRATVDVDLLVGGSCVARLDALVTPLGYVSTYSWEESSHFRSADEMLCPLDVLHAHRPHSLAMLERASRVDVGGCVEIPVVQLEDLVGLKVQAMVNDPDRRRGETVDIRALFEAAAARGAGVDMERVREYFALFSEERELEELLTGLEHALG